jgi:tripartite-type tricarboxylate transporter receptor subunit TctC
VKDFETTAWWGIFAPANLPPDIVKRLNTEINAVIASKGFQDLLVPQGVTVMGDTPEEFAKFQQAEIAKWGKAVHDSGASID